MDSKKKEQEAAAAELEAYLNKTRPKNLAEGVTSGVENVIQGAVGVVGSVVLTPVVGLAAGYKQAGILGSAVGLVSGAVAGVVGGVASATGGVVKGAAQIIRGVASVPQSIIAPSHGKWWNDIDGKWVETNLKNEADIISKVPNDDSDILGEKSSETVDTKTEDFQDPKVKDPFYYEVLGVATDSDQAKIKRQYYLLARKCHPDKVGDDQKAVDKFQNISEAYQVLSDPELRSIYDRDGRDGLTADKTSAAQLQNQPDPAILFAFLFGSDQFSDYIGRLAAATSALIGGNISIKDARKLQVRRCTRLALKLVQRIESWVGENDTKSAETAWKVKAEELRKASFGHQLVYLLGQVYSLAATQFLGSFESGIGMPSISKWAKGESAKFQKNRAVGKAQVDTLNAALKATKLGKEAEAELARARTEAERNAIAQDLAKEQLSVVLQIMWTMTAVDVTSTLYEVCQMVFFDKAVSDKSILKQRAEAVQRLGKVFMACPAVEGKHDPTKVYAEAAFAAMLETVKRKEDASFKAGFRGFK